MTALRFALRELRGGLSGLRLLAVCLVLGVAAIAGVGSLSRAITQGLADQGQLILGGDVEARITQRRATPAERRALEAQGRVSEVVRLRAMVGEGERRTLSELKAVDTSYPLYGRFSLSNGATLGPGQVAIAPALADRLALKAGDRVGIGASRFTVAGVIAEEPDKAGEGFGFGPGAIIRLADLEPTGLTGLGSLYRTHYRVALPSGTNAGVVRAALENRWKPAGLQFRDSSNGAPGTRNFIERLGQFLTLVGLTALVVAGVGVGNGVASYLDSKSNSIATLKTMGADTALIFRSYLAQITLVALGAVLVGLAIGAAIPWLVVAIAASALPVAPTLSVFWEPLATAAAYGLLIAIAFALWPLAQAARLPAARLFRAGVEGRRWPGPWIVAAVALAALAIGALALLQARDREFAAMFIAGALALLVLLSLLAALIRWLAARAPRPRGTLARLALANLHRPGALTRQLVVALGLGLTLFATLAVIETNLAGQIDRTVPERAPSYFVVDIPTGEIDAFRALAARTAPGSQVRTVPSLRGPVTAVKGVPVASMKNIPPNAWILNGDRGLSYAAEFPPNNELVSGKWWPSDYRGPPLISVDSVAAEALGLKLGDTLTLSVLGVELTATIASTRKIDWQSLGFNFAILFSPGALEGAPHTWMATVEMAPAQERAFAAAVGRDFPTAALVRVKDVLGQVSDVLVQLAAAIRAAASVTVAAGIAVLVGALAAGRRARTYDAVLLKVLGATRGQIARATLLEYGLLAAIVAGLALALGGGAGWYVVTQVFQLDWTPDWGPVVATVLVGGALTVLLGLAGSWAALRARPNAVLRTL